MSRDNIEVSTKSNEPEYFYTTNPATGTEIARHKVTSRDEVNLAVARAQGGARRWQELGSKQRKKILLSWAKYLTQHIDEGALKIYEETGKPEGDAKLEFTLAIGHLAWAAKNASHVLAPQLRNPGLLMANMRAKVERHPYGVIGVIGPWNYPVFTPMGSIAYALASANAVVFKPSEFTPGVGLWLAKTFVEATGIYDLFTVITGLGETGKYLTESKVDKISFTGSTRTAKKVAASCAESMTPVVLECGGKDPVLIAADADIKRAAENTLWSAMSNAGQTCIGAERVYVVEEIAEQFIEELKSRAAELQPGINYGPATMPSQLKVIASHLQDAQDKGGTFILGGLDSIGERFVHPVLITDLDESALALQEETFGPTLVINRVRTIDEAIELANATKYGLGAAVWSKRHGDEIAARLHAGMVSVNSVISFAAVASVPFGGVKESGYGRIHGAEGLLEFTYPKSTVSAKYQLPIAFTSFQRSKFADNLIIRLVKTLHGKSLG